jgi:hypothetical protein
LGAAPCRCSHVFLVGPISPGPQDAHSHTQRFRFFIRSFGALEQLEIASSRRVELWSSTRAEITCFSNLGTTSQTQPEPFPQTLKNRRYNKDPRYQSTHTIFHWILTWNISRVTYKACDICEVPYGSRYMKSVFYHAPQTVSESCYVIFGLSKFSRAHLMRGGEQFLKYLGDKYL